MKPIPCTCTMCKFSVTPVRLLIMSVTHVRMLRWHCHLKIVHNGVKESVFFEIYLTLPRLFALQTDIYNKKCKSNKFDSCRFLESNTFWMPKSTIFLRKKASHFLTRAQNYVFLPALERQEHFKSIAQLENRKFGSCRS